MTTRARHNWTEAERKRAVALYEEHGPSEASRLLTKETGHKATSKTIWRWAKKAGVLHDPMERMKAAHEAESARQAVQRERIKGKLLDQIEAALERMNQPHIDFKGGGNMGPVEVVYPTAPAGAWQNYATTVGILIDKYRLESGDVTTREEVRHDYADRPTTDLIAEAEAILRDAAERK